MHSTDTITRLTEIAHDLWRDLMEQRGWTFGPEHDAGAKRHDALVPFSQLGAPDRRQALLGITAMELLEDLADAIRYERGPARLFLAEEMHEGCAVGWNTEHCEPGPDAPPEPGRVVAWQVRDGLLRSVTVEWADGSRSEHDPEARELRRLGDAHRSPPA